MPRRRRRPEPVRTPPQRTFRNARTPHGPRSTSMSRACALALALAAAASANAPQSPPRVTDRYGRVWDTVWDHKSQRPYYVNARDGSTAWALEVDAPDASGAPTQMRPPQSQQPQAPRPAAQAQAQQPPRGPPEGSRQAPPQQQQAPAQQQQRWPPQQPHAQAPHAQQAPAQQAPPQAQAAAAAAPPQEQAAAAPQSAAPVAAARPQYWPSDEPWPAKDGPIEWTEDSMPPNYVLRSGRTVSGRMAQAPPA
mmetsp:Transcript_23615/g.72942  ORF Transcript_23615/g.72942 Transcript_23615/m.72942 type:complete len:251 (-) Transcript_23615:27-779(-)